MSLYGLQGQFKAIPGQRDALVDILRAAVEGVRLAPGCILYVVSTTPEDPDAILVYEVWRSKADHDNSLQNEATRALIARARPLLAAAPEGREITPVVGVGV